MRPINNELFLTIYQQIEQEIKENHPEIIVPGQNVVFALTTLPQFQGREDLLLAMKNIRNILSHYKQINGEPVFIVNDCLIKASEQILRELKEPHFIVLEKQKTASYDTLITDVLKMLKAQTLVPILNPKRQIVGVVSANHLPEILCSKKMSDTATLKDFKKLFGIDDYLYSKPEVTKQELQQIVQDNQLVGNHVAGFIFTETGNSKETFIGIIKI